MEYILNKTPLRTSNNFKINDFKIDLDIKETKFNDYKCNVETKTSIKDNLESKIGLPSNKYFNVDVKSDKENILIEYDFDKNNYLASQINIDINDNNNYIIIFRSKTESLLNTKVVINSNKDTISNISIINLLSNDSRSFISIENNSDTNSKTTVNYVELGGKLKVSNYYSMLNGEGSENYFNALYLGSEEDKIDMNYYLGNNNKNTIGNINVVGSLSGDSYKSFKGTIDFYEGSSKSVGEENENCILLSDTATSRSLPMLLCHEEDVVGAHGVSTGKIDEEKLFYLMSRGIEEKDAKRLIINANYNTVIDNIPDENTKDLLRRVINERI